MKTAAFSLFWTHRVEYATSVSSDKPARLETEKYSSQDGRDVMAEEGEEREKGRRRWAVGSSESSETVIMTTPYDATPPTPFLRGTF